MNKPLRDVLYGPSRAHKMARKLQCFRVGPVSYRQQSDPYCDEPVPVIINERGESNERPGAYIELRAPCRKCGKCKLYRQLQWRDRMRNELLSHPRSWFVTLTFSPLHLAGILAESHHVKGSTETERVERAAYAHVQKYFKRLRKSCGSFRYVAVPEYGSENGRLHYHLLIHEAQEGQIRYRVLNAKWRSFVQANLVRSGRGCASYVSKYLTKAISKPRASKAYGKNGPGISIPSLHPKGVKRPDVNKVTTKENWRLLNAQMEHARPGSVTTAQHNGPYDSAATFGTASFAPVNPAPSAGRDPSRGAVSGRWPIIQIPLEGRPFAPG